MKYDLAASNLFRRMFNNVNMKRKRTNYRNTDYLDDVKLNSQVQGEKLKLLGIHPYLDQARHISLLSTSEARNLNGTNANL